MKTATGRTITRIRSTGRKNWAVIDLLASL
jgi:hypothetical protein